MENTHFFSRAVKKIQALIFEKILQLESNEIDTLLYWRIQVMFSIVFTGATIGFILLITVLPAIIEHKLWGLLAFDSFVWGLCIMLLAVPKISYSFRSVVFLFIMYGLGVVIIINLGPLSGGPIWLFCFGIFSGILLGWKAALVAVLLNAATISMFGYLLSNQLWGGDLPVFKSNVAMVAAGFNFIFLNALAAISVSVLLKGLTQSHEKEKELTDSLQTEQHRLLEAKANLEQEVKEKKLTAVALRESEKKYRQLFENAPSAMYEIDFIANKFTNVNELMYSFLGYTEEEFLRRNPFDFLTPESLEVFQRNFKKIRSGEDVSDNTEYHVVKKDGTTECILLSSEYVYKNGRITGARVVLHNITERKKIEEMMVHSEKMISIGGLATGMAHEINNPLAGMMQNAQVIHSRLTKDLPANTETAKDLGTSMDVIKKFMEKRGVITQLESINQAGRRAAKIIGNMLSFSGKRDSTGKNVDLVGLMDKTVELAKSDYDLKKRYDFKSVEIIREYEQGVPPVFCYESKIQQVLFNILRNASESMGLKNEKSSERVILRLKKQGENALIEIEDNGPGMDDITRKRIFEPFYTTKGFEQGTGLGLSVSYFIIVNDHNGQMEVESESGKGTKFIIRLPFQPLNT